MRLLNLCIGEIQTIHIGGEPVQTAHMKAPVTEHWCITDEGPSGDRRAVLRPSGGERAARSADDRALARRCSGSLLRRQSLDESRRLVEYSKMLASPAMFELNMSLAPALLAGWLLQTRSASGTL